MKAHKKKRNAGLVYEFLLRAISVSLVEHNDKRYERLLSLLKRFYDPGTELYKEFRLMNSLVQTQVASENIASSILQECKRAVQRHDAQKLGEEKTKLIETIERTIDDQVFWDRPVEHYKLYATIQTLCNDWRNVNESNLSRVAQYEQIILDWLCRKEEQKVSIGERTIEETRTAGENRALYRIMSQKLNEKYGWLSPRQKQILRSYVFDHKSETNDKITQYIEEERSGCLKTIENALVEFSSNGLMVSQLNETKKLLQEENLQTIDDATITRFMMYSKIVEEIQGLENAS